MNQIRLWSKFSFLDKLVFISRGCGIFGFSYGIYDGYKDEKNRINDMINGKKGQSIYKFGVKFNIENPTETNYFGSILGNSLAYGVFGFLTPTFVLTSPIWLPLYAKSEIDRSRLIYELSRNE